VVVALHYDPARKCDHILTDAEANALCATYHAAREAAVAIA
jgi:hypothetical protein